MIYLYILKEEGSLYWKDFFDSKELADKWLETEKTRPYWNKEFKIFYIDSEDAHDSEVEEGLWL